MDDQGPTGPDGDHVIDLTGTGPVPAPDPTWIRAELDNFASEFLVLVMNSGRLVSTSVDGWPGDQSEDRGLDHYIAEFVHPDDLPVIFELAERARHTPGFEASVRARARHRDGTWRILDARVYDASLKSDLEGAVLRVRDVTEEHNRAFSPSDVDRFSALAEMLPLGILSADERGRVVYANEVARRIFNLDDRELRGLGWRSRVVPEDWPDVAEACQRVVRTGVHQQASFRVDTGLFVRWAQATFGPLGAPGEATGWIATVADITERQSVEGRLAHQATHDPLTGLPNRALLEDRLSRSLAGLRRDLASVTVVFLDLDGFKAVNDTYGHGAGDAVLVEVARRLRQVTRDVDTVARLGGDEFVLVCDALDEPSTQGLVARIDEALRDPIRLGADDLSIRSSIGVAIETVGCSTDELIARADQAMYRNKRVHRRNA